jgi:hypothetical protein
LVVQHVDVFVKTIAREEKNYEKSEKLKALVLTPGEWERVKVFLGLLGVRR